MAESNRRGDEDAAGEHVDDVFDDAVDDDASADDEASVSGSGGTATKALPKGKKVERTEGGGGGPFGRLGRFAREIIAELRKVIWPTRKELLTYTAVVVAFVTVMLAIVGLLDLGFAKVVLFIFGHGSK